MSTDTTAIVQAPATGIVSQRASVTRDLLAIDTEQRKVLAEYVAKHMVKGQDFGVIPGTDKPTLLKPGAEKLTDLFRCTPKFSLVKEFSKEDWGVGFFKYTFRCRLMQRDTEAVLAEGFGSANSRESRYRWRSAKRVCPDCGKSDALNKSKPPKQGYYCWDKKGGCGANFEGNDKRITEQVLGRVENVDIADLDNTILKMAKKRALVDGAIALARCSDMFTQDVEDLMEMATDGDEPPPPKTEPKTAPAQQGERRTQAQAPREARQPLAPAPKQSAPAEVVPFERQAGKPPMTNEQVAKVESVATQLGGQVTRGGAAAAGVVSFGAHKGLSIVDLTDGQLSESVDLANVKLLEEPGAKWAKKMEANRELLLAELERRGHLANQQPERQPGED